MNAIELRFGNDAKWLLPGSEKIKSFLKPEIEPLEELDSAVDVALSNPIDFPPLDQAVVPGDSLALAVDPVVPRLPELVASIVAWFANRGTDASNMRVVIAGSVPRLSVELARAIQERLGVDVPVENHDPNSPTHLAYVAANEDSDPIYVNRTLVDADVVIPIGCARAESSLDYFGACALFPLLSDRATRGQFYGWSRLTEPESRAKLRSWADQAAWWTGFLAAIQVIPAGQDQVGAILAGALEPLEDKARCEMNQAWRTNAQAAELVIALLDGGEAQQDWLGLSRALHAASQYTTPDGTIVVCTQIDTPVGKSLARLRAIHKSQETIDRKLSEDTSEDAIAAAVLHQVSRDHHVYLASDLRSETIESLGLGVLADSEQLAHLVKQFTSCVILGSAQHRGVRVTHP